MGSGGKKQKQEQNYWTQAAQQSYQDTAQPSPLQQRYEQNQLDFLNWDAAPGHNVADAPGLSNYIQIGQAAQNRANQDRMGSGALALSDGGASGYAEKLKSLRQAQAGEDFGTGLENALATRRAEATGSVLPLAQVNNQRQANRMGFAGNMVGTYFNRPKQRSWWDYLREGIQMGTSVAGTVMGAG